MSSSRLGKRDFSSETSNFGDSITGNNFQSEIAPSEMNLLLSLLSSLQTNTNSLNGYNNYLTKPTDFSMENLLREGDNAPSELEIYRRLYAIGNGPTTKRHEPTNNNYRIVNAKLIDSILGESGSSSVKRVPFTPRIG